MDQGVSHGPVLSAEDAEVDQLEDAVIRLEQTFSRRITRQESKRLEEFQEFGRFFPDWCEAFYFVAQEFRTRKTTFRKYGYFVPFSMKHLLDKPDLTESSALSLCRDLIYQYESLISRRRESLIVAQASAHLSEYRAADVEKARAVYDEAMSTCAYWKSYLPVLSRDGNIPEHDYEAAKAPYPCRIAWESDGARAYNEQFYSSKNNESE